MTQRVDTRVLLMSRTLVLATQTPPLWGQAPRRSRSEWLHASPPFQQHAVYRAPLEPCAPGTVRPWHPQTQPLTHLLSSKPLIVRRRGPALVLATQTRPPPLPSSKRIVRPRDPGTMLIVRP
jgi:hypothetical protein